MERFRRMKTLQKSAAVHDTVHNHFNQERHLISRDLTENDAQPPWLSGARLWPERVASSARTPSDRRQVASTDSTRTPHVARWPDWRDIRS
jgi:hypothetical protein